MTFQSEGICVGAGEYGPFADGRTVPYIQWADADGSGVFRASVARDVTPPRPMEQGQVTLRLSQADNGKLRLSLAGFQPALAHAA